MTPSEGQHDRTPGRPLWLVAERTRGAEDLSKVDWVKKIGIGRVSYDRLATQPNPPILRTVKKIAAAIGMDLQQAMSLAGHGQEPESVAEAVLTRIIYTVPGSPIRLDIRGFDHEATERQLTALREAAEAADLTLGETLVITGLAEPEDLALSRVPVDR
ncbi:hypothetical protein ACFXJ8_12080 [Nonomuraea sp. NPDC059194]|uniref:hypothetical protein n=1 Tax=Nonomuraea sp. NPDC059194 TaxID=3346764 RepID=UPI003680C7F6